MLQRTTSSPAACLQRRTSTSSTLASEEDAGSEYRRYKSLTRSANALPMLGFLRQVATAGSLADSLELVKEASRERRVPAEDTDSPSSDSIPSLDDALSDSEDEVDPEILRGVPLSYVLSGAGDLWQTSPVDRDPEELQQIHGASRKCEQLDAFVSQTWQTPGWQRYLALLVQYHWGRAAALGLSANTALCLLEAAGRLPRLGAWSPIPAALSLAALFLGPLLPKRGDPLVFFDAVCINQTDDSAKVKGVYNLDEFLRASSELVVLWAPEYLRRMWCVYELALFSAKKDISRITVVPVAQQQLRLSLFCANALLSLAPRAARGAEVEAGLWLGLLSALTARFSLPYVRDMQRLSEQFDSFDIQQAQCRDAFDRVYVTEGIVERYGNKDNFNEYVRGTVKSRVMASVPPVGMTYQQLLGATAPLSVFLASQNIASLARDGVSSGQFLGTSLTLMVHFGVVCPACFKLQFMALPSVAKRCKSKGSEWAASLAVAALLSGALGLAHSAMGWAQRSPERTCLYVPAALLAGCAVFGRPGGRSLADREG